MAKKEDTKDAGKYEAVSPGPEISGSDIVDAEISGTKVDIETVEELEIVYPKLVSAVRDEVIDKVGQCTAKQVKANMPELYERIVIDLQGRGGPNLNVPGFLLEYDDPFARGTLEQYGIMKKLDGLSLPYVLPFNVKGRVEINAAQLTNKYEASKALKVEFKNVDAYIAFKRKIITQVLEFYILVAEGGGDYKRANNARRAMKKIK